MKKYILPVLVSCALILTSASAMASSVEVGIEPQTQSGQLYSIITFNLTITNNQEFDDIFQVTLSGDHLEWNMPGLIAKNVRGLSSDKVEIVFYPTGANKGEFGFTASATSIRNPYVTASADFLLDIPYDFAIKSFLCSYSGGAVNFNAAIQTAEGKVLKGNFGVKDSSGRIMGTVPFAETVNGEMKVESSIVPEEKPIAGMYTCYLSLENLSSYFSFSIQPVRSVSHTIEEISGAFSKDVTISITNEGNVLERDYTFQQKTPLDAMTGMMTRPTDNCREEGGEMVCNYVISQIRPGTTARVTYTVSYWPAFNGYIILTVIVISLILFSFIRTTTPKIIKHHSKRGENSHNIFINVKNPFFHRLNDVVVRDWVSPLAQVLQEEIESTRPVMRKLEDGTELIWKLGEMRPREERILQYKVRSLMHGSLRMPGAHLKFTAGKGEKKLKLISNGITLG